MCSMYILTNDVCLCLSVYSDIGYRLNIVHPCTHNETRRQNNIETTVNEHFVVKFWHIKKKKLGYSSIYKYIYTSIVGMDDLIINIYCRWTQGTL